MPHPTSRLDLLLVPADPDAPPERGAADRLLAAWQDRGILDADQRAGPAAHQVVPGGFSGVRIDDPGRIALYANQQGGFRVTCPSCGANLVPALNKGLEAFRAGGPRTLECPECRAGHPLEALDYEPPAAYGPWAVVLIEAERAALAEGARALIEKHLGPVVVVPRRGT